MTSFSESNITQEKNKLSESKTFKNWNLVPAKSISKKDVDKRNINTKNITMLLKYTLIISENLLKNNQNKNDIITNMNKNKESE